MKLATLTDGQPALVTPRGIVPVGDVASNMRVLIDRFGELQAKLRQRESDGAALEGARLGPPIVPGKILCSTNRFATDDEPTPLLMTLKSAESIIGPDQSMLLPDTFEAWDLYPEAELGLVIKGPAKQLIEQNWQQAVFGYTCVIDVMARGGDPMYGRDYWVSKSDTLCPIGPWITTADEIGDAEQLCVQSWQNGQPAQDYSTAMAQYSLARQIEFITSVMTLESGDVIAAGTAGGARPMQDGDQVEIELQRLGRLRVGIKARVAA
jgi:2-keto-4-pentenoate hydratase/2-oxohepta-3-ene-1,7-dioic acid hydratase in catechol pathway